MKQIQICKIRHWRCKCNHKIYIRTTPWNYSLAILRLLLDGDRLEVFPKPFSVFQKYDTWHQAVAKLRFPWRPSLPSNSPTTSRLFSPSFPKQSSAVGVLTVLLKGPRRVSRHADSCGPPAAPHFCSKYQWIRDGPSKTHSKIINLGKFLHLAWEW